MTEWQDPQTRAGAEDRERGYSALPVDETADTREKLEADVYDGFRALDETEQVRDIWRSRVHGWLDRQAAITRRETLLENPLHNNPYVGLVRGKQWERKESSDYYCGKCGWKVTDHDSYCPECGGALHNAPNKLISQSDAPKTEETAENGATKSEMRDFDDSRVKLEADVEAHYTHTVSTAMWPDSANRRTRYVSVPMGKVLGWLDRQAAITERETVKQWEEQASELACHVNELQAERDHWKDKADMYRRQLGGLSAAHARLKREVRR